MSRDGVLLEFPPPSVYGQRDDVTVLVLVPPSGTPLMWNWWHRQETYERACDRLRGFSGRPITKEELGVELFDTIMRAARMIREG